MRVWILAAAVLGLHGAARAEWKVAASGRYVCADGSEAAMSEQAYGTMLRHGGREVQLSRKAAWSGFSYAGDGVALRGRGEEGAKTLTITATGQTPLECRAVPAVATPGVATGTVTYLARVALPKGAVVAVELRDTALADAKAPLLARTELRPRGNQVPLHWRLDYDARRAVHPARPSLSARITDAAGKLLWISDTFTPVAVGAEGAHAEAEIRVVPVRR
nr:YbaY family lipoprotein [Polymorphobacter sp.]